MSPTSYQAAPPRVIDTTLLVALLQILQPQVPDKCPKFLALLHAVSQIAPSARPKPEHRCSEWLKCCRALKAWTPQTRTLPREVVSLRTCAGTCADGRPQLSAFREGAVSTEGQRSTVFRSSWRRQSLPSCRRYGHATRPRSAKEWEFL